MGVVTSTIVCLLFYGIGTIRILFRSPLRRIYTEFEQEKGNQLCKVYVILFSIVGCTAFVWGFFSIVGLATGDEDYEFTPKVFWSFVFSFIGCFLFSFLTSFAAMTFVAISFGYRETVASVGTGMQ